MDEKSPTLFQVFTKLYHRDDIIVKDHRKLVQLCPQLVKQQSGFVRPDAWDLQMSDIIWVWELYNKIFGMHKRSSHERSPVDGDRVIGEK